MLWIKPSTASPIQSENGLNVNAQGLVSFKPKLRLWHCIEAAVMETSVLLLGVLVFFCKSPLEYGLLPLMIWAALRFGVSGAIACGLTTVILSTLSTALGYGPFVRSTSQHSLISLYAFLAVTIVCTLYLAGVFAERKKAEEEVRRLNAELEQLVRNRTAQLEATNQELSRSNAELGEFAHVASHDLQEPLRTVSSCVQILQKRYAGVLDAYANEIINHTVSGCQHMRERINAVLAMAHVNATPDCEENVDTAMLVEQVRSGIEHAIKESGAILTYGELPCVQASPQLLAQLFQNLIGNALKFRGDGPAVVHVSAVRKAGEWVFSVADQGIGIDPEHFDRIFQLFQRLHTEERFAGTGLGLAICKTIVTRHGGRIWVESQPGRGAAFFFTLPVNSCPGQAPGHETGPGLSLVHRTPQGRDRLSERSTCMR
ncbi:MAG: ATP-binding protein [Verrucomicrobiota bacterium]